MGHLVPGKPRKSSCKDRTTRDAKLVDKVVFYHLTNDGASSVQNRVESKGNTVEPRYNEPLYNEIPGIMHEPCILQPGQSYSEMYGTEPDITITFSLYLGTSLYRSFTVQTTKETHNTAIAHPCLLCFVPIQAF